jgi:hypothetical protein
MNISLPKGGLVFAELIVITCTMTPIDTGTFVEINDAQFRIAEKTDAFFSVTIFVRLVPGVRVAVAVAVDVAVAVATGNG